MWVPEHVRNARVDLGRWWFKTGPCRSVDELYHHAGLVANGLKNEILLTRYIKLPLKKNRHACKILDDKRLIVIFFVKFLNFKFFLFKIIYKKVNLVIKNKQHPINMNFEKHVKE